MLPLPSILSIINSILLDYERGRFERIHHGCRRQRRRAGFWPPSGLANHPTGNPHPGLENLAGGAGRGDLKRSGGCLNRKSNAPSFSPLDKYKYILREEIHQGAITLPGFYTRAGAEETLALIGSAIEVHCDLRSLAGHVTDYDKIKVVDDVLIVIMIELAVFLLVNSLSQSCCCSPI